MGKCYKIIIDTNFSYGDIVMLKFNANKNLFDHNEIKLYILPKGGYDVGFQGSLFDLDVHEMIIHEREEITAMLEVHEHNSFTGCDMCDQNTDQEKFAKCFQEFRENFINNQSVINCTENCNGATYTSCKIPHVSIAYEFIKRNTGKLINFDDSFQMKLILCALMANLLVAHFNYKKTLGTSSF